ncbi:DUF6473 family protein [Maritimibacter fusiformis]|uniref:DUF6473 domain-containing protein n=1 Tax=Maritimibacter fusiformis TaxID=2603819 RepID=A0A5D0REF5_9RHOB|nr:DUF6473 family protein [Maritimibacter fusiformis]TYB80070.1 hypothetical protein FVF75_14665 [Maritimibacter fusiformis]
MAYDHLGAGALDYLSCRYGKSKLLFRGPKRKLEGRYIAAIGGTETYGKFIPRPYPDRVEAALGTKVVNLGCVNAGIDVFSQDQAVMEACSGAAVTVIEVPGAQNMSNRFYAVHPRRNDRFLRASTLLKSFYREVDFTEFHFTRHLLSALRAADADRFQVVEHELKEAWVARMKALMSRIDSKVVLLWLAGHRPEDCTTCSDQDRDPLYVDRAMLEAVKPYAAQVVEVVVGPQDVAAGREGMIYSDLEAPAAEEMLGVQAHQAATEALAPVLKDLL